MAPRRLALVLVAGALALTGCQSENDTASAPAPAPEGRPSMTVPERPATTAPPARTTTPRPARPVPVPAPARFRLLGPREKEPGAAAFAAQMRRLGLRAYALSGGPAVRPGARATYMAFAVSAQGTPQASVVVSLFDSSAQAARQRPRGGGRPRMFQRGGAFVELFMAPDAPSGLEEDLAGALERLGYRSVAR